MAKKEKVTEAPKEEAKPAKPAVKEAVAFARDVRVTPRKIRFVIDAVRGHDVKEALAFLKRVNRSASAPVMKVIKSAAANATNNFGLDEDKLFIAEIQASDGVRMKRFTPRAKGSASPIIKRMANIRVVVKERE
jgi:large subunit ribosomal protein L22